MCSTMGKLTLSCKQIALSLISSIENCIKMCFFSFQVFQQHSSADRSTDKKVKKIVLLLMPIDNLMDLSLVEALSSKRRSVKTYTHRAVNNGHFFSISNRSIDNRQCSCVSRLKFRKGKTLGVQKSGRIKRNKLLRIIQICYRKLRFEAVFACTETEKTKTLMKLTLFCVSYCTFTK